MDTDSFYPLVETDNLYKDNSRYVEKWFDTSNTCRKKQKMIGLMKDEKGGKIIKDFPQRLLNLLLIVCKKMPMK